nr:MAG TPA: Sporulation protein Cse60 [Caudoviricetes sp.]
MIQAKVFKENTGSDLEWDVNNFFKRNLDAELVDIKF